MNQATILKRTRSDKKMTQKLLAHAAAVSVKTVIRAEAGVQISDENLRSICSVLGLDAASLPRTCPMNGAIESNAVEGELSGDLNATSGFKLGTGFAGSFGPGANLAFKAVNADFKGLSGPSKGLCAATAIAIAWAGFGLGSVSSKEDAYREAMAMMTMSPHVAARTPGGNFAIGSAVAASPHRGKAEVLRWVDDAVVRSFTFTYTRIDQEETELSRSFTPTGWISYKKSLETSGMIDAIRNSKYVTDGQKTDETKILSVETINGHYAWKLKIPMSVIYSTPSSRTTQPLDVTVIVAEQGDENNSLAIVSFVSE